VAAKKDFFWCVKLPSRLLRFAQETYSVHPPHGHRINPALWLLPFLKSKAGIKKPRSLQSIFLKVAIGEFKVVSTEALLLFKTAIPIHFWVAEITTTKF
jgi:hypothetical protein